ncbi:hypothetical protein, partial [Acetobacter okinawensis]|uniref:hypothetical protein n=1 Tax=Acetobacter okinawensis TaxID=1076594 RepID=UPI001C5AE095
DHEGRVAGAGAAMAGAVGGGGSVGWVIVCGNIRAGYAALASPDVVSGGGWGCCVGRWGGWGS